MQEDQADLREVIERTVKPYSEGSGAIVIVPDQTVLLQPSQVVSLSRVVNELASTAVKYGALSTHAGKIEIQCETENASPPDVRLVWWESGRPPVNPPTTAGFGTRLVRFTVNQELGGRVELNYPEGLGVEIIFPL